MRLRVGFVVRAVAACDDDVEAVEQSMGREVMPDLRVG